MVVDGEVLIRSELAAYLRDCGYTVIEAANTDEAVIVLSEPGLDVDAVLCDVKIAGSMNGFAFARWVKSNRPELEVLLAGDLAKAADAAAGLCDDGPRLGRPYDPSSVVDRIKQQIAARDRNLAK